MGRTESVRRPPGRADDLTTVRARRRGLLPVLQGRPDTLVARHWSACYRRSDHECMADGGMGAWFAGLPDSRQGLSQRWLLFAAVPRRLHRIRSWPGRVRDPGWHRQRLGGGRRYRRSAGRADDDRALRIDRWRLFPILHRRSGALVAVDRGSCNLRWAHGRVGRRVVGGRQAGLPHLGCDVRTRAQWVFPALPGRRYPLLRGHSRRSDMG